MAPLSHDLAGLILPHQHFGSHLNSSLKCIDTKLEKKNFSKTGSVLAEVWSKTVIDGEPVIAQYVKPSTQRPIPMLQNEEWRSQHVRTSQYLLQVVKCKNESCCKQFRSTLDQVLKGRFLPPPVKYTRRQEGVVACDPTDINAGHFGSLQTRVLLSSILPQHKFKFLPFDLYCPSLRSSISSRICSTCSIYFCSATRLKNHQKNSKCDPFTGEETEPESDEETVRAIKNDSLLFDDESVPIISIEKFLENIYETVD